MSQDVVSARPCRDKRRRAILQTAWDVFVREGYGAASMSEIATRVGGSKGTLYNYFPSKEALFRAMVDDGCLFHRVGLNDLDPDAVDPPAALAEVGRLFIAYISTDRVRALQRLLIAESERFPELGRAFYEVGPKATYAALGAWVEAQMAAGRLKRANPVLAAGQFIELCKAGLHHRLLWIGEAPSAREAEDNVAAAVEVFMARYGVAREGAGAQAPTAA